MIFDAKTVTPKRRNAISLARSARGHRERREKLEKLKSRFWVKFQNRFSLRSLRPRVNEVNRRDAAFKFLDQFCMLEPSDKDSAIGLTKKWGDQ
jgi:hypothetical protein